MIRKKKATPRPRSPRPSKYSALARKRTRRGTASGMTTLSMKLRWLLAMITGPVRGMFSTPTSRGRQTTRNRKPAIHFASVYDIGPPLDPLCAGAD
jgi:hypothetical protein